MTTQNDNQRALEALPDIVAAGKAIIQKCDDMGDKNNRRVEALREALKKGGF